MAFIGADCIALITDMYQELVHKETFAPTLEELKKRLSTVAILILKSIKMNSSDLKNRNP
jgi:hypothetical protein